MSHVAEESLIITRNTPPIHCDFAFLRRKVALDSNGIAENDSTADNENRHTRVGDVATELAVRLQLSGTLNMSFGDIHESRPHLARRLDSDRCMG